MWTVWRFVQAIGILEDYHLQTEEDETTQQKVSEVCEHGIV